MADKLTIANATDHAKALQKLSDFKTGLKTAIDAFDRDVKRDINVVRNYVLSVEHEITDPLNAAIDVVNRKCDIYEREERERAAQRARIEREKAEREAKERAEKEARELEAAAKKARGIEKEELKREAELVRTQPPPVDETAIAERSAPALADSRSYGLSRRANWKAKLNDVDKLIDAVIAGKVSRRCLVADQSFLDQQAKALKDDMNKPLPTGDYPWPGVSSYDEGKRASR